jgi:hypothetical protein
MQGTGTDSSSSSDSNGGSRNGGEAQQAGSSVRRVSRRSRPRSADSGVAVLSSV